MQRFILCNCCQRFVDNCAHYECYYQTGWVNGDEIKDIYECEYCGVFGEPGKDICLFNKKVCKDCLISNGIGRRYDTTDFRDFCTVCLLDAGIIEHHHEDRSRCCRCRDLVEFYSFEIYLDDDNNYYCQQCAKQVKEENSTRDNIIYIHSPEINMCEYHQKFVQEGRGHELNPEYQ